MSDHQQSYREESAANAERVDSEINDLENGHWDNFRRDYKSFFSHAKEIGELFRTIRPLAKDERERLWSRFNGLCEQVRTSQDEERLTRKVNSEQRRDIIESELGRARHQGLAAELPQEFQDAISRLKQVREWINGESLDAYNSAPGPLLKNDRQELWERINETIDEVFGHRLDVRSTNHSQLADRAGECYDTAAHGNPHDALKTIRDVQGDMRESELSKEQRQSIREILDRAWERAHERINEIKEEKRRKHEEWRERMESNVDRWKDKISDLEQYRERLESLIRDDEERIANSKSDDFADKVRDWIREKEDKIAKLNASLDLLHEKISSVEAELGKH